MGKYKIILISGWYGYGNLGDEAILYSMHNQITSELKNVDIRVLSFCPEYNRQFQQVNAYFQLPFGLKSWLKAIAKGTLFRTLFQFFWCDIFILGGGGFLSDWQSEAPWFWLRQVLIAKLFRKKVMIYGIGAGPFMRYFGKWLTRFIINYFVDIVTVRDNISRNCLVSIGVLNNKIIVSADPALSFPFLNSNIQRKKVNNIGICVAPLFHLENFWPGKKQKYYKYITAIAETIDTLVKQNFNVFFILMQKATDEPFAKEIIAKCKESVYILPASSDINSTILSLTNADIVIAMRCHAAILSASQGIPVVGIVYHHKVSEFLRSIGLIDFAEEIGDGINWRESDINTNNLVSNINNLITNYADICHIMNHHIESLKNSEKQNIFCLSKLL